ncbi:hypothetical protein ABTN40_19660, partial [Acinetobacter baumannii]
IRPCHVMHRAAADRTVSFADLYTFLEPGELLAGTTHTLYRNAWDQARADSFHPGPARALSLAAKAAE